MKSTTTLQSADDLKRRLEECQSALARRDEEIAALRKSLTQTLVPVVRACADCGADIYSHMEPK